MYDAFVQRIFFKSIYGLVGIDPILIGILAAQTWITSPVIAQTQAPTVLITESNRGIGFAFVQVYIAQG